MSNPYTDGELREFDRLTERLSSRAQMERLNARFAVKKFVEAHGKEKCDAMFAALKQRDEAEG